MIQETESGFAPNKKDMQSNLLAALKEGGSIIDVVTKKPLPENVATIPNDVLFDKHKSTALGERLAYEYLRQALKCRVSPEAHVLIVRAMEACR